VNRSGIQGLSFLRASILGTKRCVASRIRNMYRKSQRSRGGYRFQLGDAVNTRKTMSRMSLGTAGINGLH
jgi:hypothetical protein